MAITGAVPVTRAIPTGVATALCDRGRNSLRFRDAYQLNRRLYIRRSRYHFVRRRRAKAGPRLGAPGIPFRKNAIDRVTLLRLAVDQISDSCRETPQCRS